MAALTESELPQTGRGLRWRLASDQVLARAAAAGAEGAFDEIYTRYQPALVRHCRAVLLDADEAQDAAQNALTSALRALRRGTSEPVSLKAWLYRIAHNEAVTLARRRADQRARRAPGDGSELELLSVAGPGDDDTRERLQELVVDLRELPDRQRNALLLRELSGLGYDEVAEALGTSAGAARQTVFEARAALMDIGAGRGDDCDNVQRALSDGDGRVKRGRRIRSHLRGCGGCAAFAAQIDARERDLALAFPLGPALVLFGGGAGASAAGLAGAGAVAGGGWSLGLGASVAIKCATFCAAAAVLGTVAIDHQPGAGLGQRPGRSHHSGPVQVASAPRHNTRQAPIVLPVKNQTAASHARRSAAVRRTVSSHATGQARIVPATHRSITAHLPAATAAPQHTNVSVDTSAPAAVNTPATTTTNTAATATSSRAMAYTIPAIAQHALQAAQQIASNAMQQGLALAQQMAAQAMSGFMHRSSGAATTSADAPASSTTP